MSGDVPGHVDELPSLITRACLGEGELAGGDRHEYRQPAQFHFQMHAILQILLDSVPVNALLVVIVFCVAMYNSL